jgi:hypothetical protein
VIYRKQPALLQSRGKHKTANSRRQSHKNVVGMDGRRELQAVSCKLQAGYMVFNIQIKTKKADHNDLHCKYQSIL